MSPRRHWLPLLSVVALLLTPFALAPRFSAAQAEAAIYTVTTTADTLAGDCRPTPATCSLRQAILAANADGVTSLIQFSLPAGLQTVTPSSVLPALSGTGDRVLGQEDNFGRPRIVIDGGNSLRYGFQVTGSNNTIERLIFNRFVSGSAPNGVGVWITGAGATGNRLFGNYFGVQPGSTSSFTNQRGIQIDNGASANIIGGALGEPTQRNIIAGNNFSGVFISGANGNFVRGNYIGLTLDAGGAVAALGNNGPGIEISESTTNEVGGSFAQRNLIADNAEAGVAISGAAASGNRVRSNYIGTNDFASAALGTQDVGVLLELGARNNSLTGSQADPLVISGNTAFGVLMRGSGTTGNSLAGAYVGTTGDSRAAVANAVGVRIEDGANRNTVGPAAVVSGNTADAISIGLTLPTATSVISNVVRASFIGLSRGGTDAVPNGGRGVAINSGARETVVGGNLSADANYIAANGGAAIQISGPNTALTVARNNLIGLRNQAAPPAPAAFTAPAPNGGPGILVNTGARQTTLQNNTVAGDANTTATDFPAISVVGDGSTGPRGALSATNVATVTISSNRIGWLPEAQGSSNVLPFPNSDGVAVSGRVQNINILTNTIRLNLGAGVRLSDVLTATVRGNLAINRNAGGGILAGGASRNLVLQGNTVSENGRDNANAVANPAADGIFLNTAASIEGATILSNTIRANTGRGIALQGDVNRATMRFNYLAQNGGPIRLIGSTLFSGTPPDPDTQATPNRGIDPPIVDLSFTRPLSLRLDQTGFFQGFVFTTTATSEAAVTPISACPAPCTVQVFRPDRNVPGDTQGGELVRTYADAGTSSAARDQIPVAQNGSFGGQIRDGLTGSLLFIATDGYGNSSEYATLPLTPSLSLEIEPPSSLAQSAGPGETVTYTLRLRNPGTIGYTNLRLNRSGTLSGWTFASTPLANSVFSLPAGATRLVTATLRLPAGTDPSAAAGRVDRTTVQITGGPPTVNAAVQLVTTVLPRPVILRTPATSSGSGRPQTVVPHAFTLRNNGNVTVTLDIAARTIDPANSPSGWNTSLSASVLTLAPGAEGRLGVSVTVPQGALQNVAATTLLTATVRPGVAPGPVFPSQAVTFSAVTRAELSPAADLFPDQEGEGLPGGTVPLVHTVENKSNGPATFCLDYFTASQSAVRFVSITNGFTINSNNCFTLPTPVEGQPSQAQFRAEVTVSGRLTGGDLETVTIFLRVGSPAGESLSDATVVDTIRVTGPTNVRLFFPLLRR